MHESIQRQWLQLIHSGWTKSAALRTISRECGLSQKEVQEILTEANLWRVSDLKPLSTKTTRYKNEEPLSRYAEESPGVKKKIGILAVIVIVLASLSFLLFGTYPTVPEPTALVSRESGGSEVAPGYSDHRDDSRYKSGSQEMRDYVDDEMEKYDRYCATSDDC